MTWIVGCIRPFCFFNDTATTEIYTLSLHDALPISRRDRRSPARDGGERRVGPAPIRRGGRAPVAGARHAYCLRPRGDDVLPDRKSKRLYSSYANISFAAFFFQKKKK